MYKFILEFLKVVEITEVLNHTGQSKWHGKDVHVFLQLDIKYLYLYIMEYTEEGTVYLERQSLRNGDLNITRLNNNTREIIISDHQLNELYSTDREIGHQHLYPHYAEAYEHMDYFGNSDNVKKIKNDRWKIIDDIRMRDITLDCILHSDMSKEGAESFHIIEIADDIADQLNDLSPSYEWEVAVSVSNREYVKKPIVFDNLCD